MVETCLRRLRLDRESMSLSATLMKRECREMCCVPTCRPVVDRCLNPVVVQGGGLAHTHANGYHDSQLMGCQPSGCCCNSIWGRLAGMPRLDEESVMAATCKASNWLGGCHLSVFGTQNRNLRASAWEGGLTTAIEKGTGNVDWMVNTMLCVYIRFIRKKHR